jgi:CRP/FNR family transcriptional regulator, cyclic AMP receptor protein
VLLTERRELVGPAPSGQFLPAALPVPKPHHSSASDHAELTTGWTTSRVEPSADEAVIRNLNLPILQPTPQTHPQEVDPLYLFACHLEWEESEETGAAWELIAAARSSCAETREHARALIKSSRHMAGLGSCSGRTTKKKRPAAMETDDMDAPYGLDIIDNCSECTNMCPGFFCSFSDSTLQSLSEVSHKSVLPAGAILFVEGQSPRGLFILCSGKVNLSTTSLEGKTLIFKTAEDGAALGVSATISGKGYEATAVTATPCQVSFIDRKHFLELMETHSEVGMHTAQCLSSDFHHAYRDIHDLVLTRSSKGKLARLLLSHSEGEEDEPNRIHSIMTHEEMAQRIGASRETVTRLLGHLRKKRLIRLDGPTIVIRDRSGLKALAF